MVRQLTHRFASSVICRVAEKQRKRGPFLGDDIDDIPEADVIGAAGPYGVVYVGDPAGATQLRSWAADFEAGYAVGVGEEVPGSFDKFVPTSASSVVLIIDDLSNIDFVNWT